MIDSSFQTNEHVQQTFAWKTTPVQYTQERLFSICEADLEDVTGHERQQHQASGPKFKHLTHRSRAQPLIPSPVQTNEDVQQRYKFHGDACLEKRRQSSVLKKDGWASAKKNWKM